MMRVIDLLKRINDGVALMAGLSLLACVTLILVEIVVRQLGMPLGGTDEISGYVMAITTSWGVAYALTERAHVRIDLLRTKCLPVGKALMDCVAILALAGTAITVAWRGWPVLSKTLATGAKANTALETPLWIPQVLWWSGWVWFAVSAILIAAASLLLLYQRRYDDVNEIAGMGDEL
ncbi:TRAP transporter small permease subunit [Leucothrix arctica]|uniref:TRAP transporter small permease protein n=1 Tax=Leucothrix arctica TaxID=1481894 RepID=A0A317CBN0_9GAMM|nr:TRAP transporter small permease [Leucothrix arctica]PWQ95956.1 C4-dicarboxylate ABC transporter permease [Leucothrix arctica]